MSRESTRIINAVLCELPIEDRMCALVASILSRKREADPGVLSMLAVTTAMAKLLSARERMMVAELVRDTADEIERGREVVQA